VLFPEGRRIGRGKRLGFVSTYSPKETFLCIFPSPLDVPGRGCPRRKIGKIRTTGDTTIRSSFLSQLQNLSMCAVLPPLPLSSTTNFQFKFQSTVKNKEASAKAVASESLHRKEGERQPRQPVLSLCVCEALVSSRRASAKPQSPTVRV